MAVGAAANTANKWLDVLTGTTYTGLAGLFVKLHTGDPGAAGANAASAVTTRNALTLSVAAGGSKTLSSLASYSMTATESITHVSLWDTVGPAGGTFIASGALSASKAVNNGDTLTFNTLTVSITPIAA
jgi:hypothetical protein